MPTKSKANLDALRIDIDRIDQDILKQLSARAALAQQVGHIKTAAGQQQPADMYRPEREAQVLARMVGLNRGPLPSEAITRIYRAIIGSCMALEGPLSVAHLGPKGTFSESAAAKHFGGAAQLLPCASIDEVFRACEREEVDYAVVPMVNSTEGFVGRTLDLAVNSALKVCGEIDYRVRQNFLTKAGVPMDGIEVIFSHAQSLAQCAAWLQGHYPSVRRANVASNAEAARLASVTPKAAAIAGDQAAEAFGLEVRVPGIEDNPNNTTRFWVLGRKDVPPSGADKTSIAIATQHIAGAFLNTIEPFAQHEVSMAHIESRPMPGNQWEYVFLIDLEGHANDQKLAAALKEVQARARYFKVLGSYPKAIA